MRKALTNFAMAAAGLSVASTAILGNTETLEATESLEKHSIESNREVLSLNSQDEPGYDSISYVFTAASAAYVEQFVNALSRSDFQQAFTLFDPSGESYSASQFSAMNLYFRSKVGSWEHYDFVGTTIKEVYDQHSNSVAALPAYLYRIKLDSFSTPLLLVLFMDSSSAQPSILGYDFMPKETIEIKNVLRLWRSAIATQ